MRSPFTIQLSIPELYSSFLSPSLVLSSRLVVSGLASPSSSPNGIKSHNLPLRGNIWRCLELQIALLLANKSLYFDFNPTWKVSTLSSPPWMRFWVCQATLVGGRKQAERPDQLGQVNWRSICLILHCSFAACSRLQVGEFAIPVRHTKAKD